MTHQPHDAPQPRGEPDHAALTAALQQLESTNRHGTHAFSLKRYVRQHYDDLKEAHDKGHTWSALAQIIQSELHVEIASETLRKYMAAIRREIEGQTSDALSEEDVESSSHSSPSKSRAGQQQDSPLAKNLQPSIDREFRRSHRRSNR